MVRIVKALLLAGALPAIAFSAALALAHASGDIMSRGAMMNGQGRGDMNGGIMGGGRHGRMMGQGMQGCVQMMMNGMRGGESQRPNQQWRQH